eukprot:FN601703.1.p2 GENE.FN601703.1~~FN601703.1.p2  ORF type:complete len:59 (-),score=5.72 FN601703.1:71-247(-)
MIVGMRRPNTIPTIYKLELGELIQTTIHNAAIDLLASHLLNGPLGLHLRLEKNGAHTL